MSEYATRATCASCRQPRFCAAEGGLYFCRLCDTPAKRAAARVAADAERTGKAGGAS